MIKKNKNSITLQDIGDKLGISAKAVSFGLNGTGRLAPQTRELILKTAKDMGYVPNVAARSLVTNRSYLIGVLVPFLNDSFFSRIIAGIEEVIHNNNLSLLLANLVVDKDDCYKAVARLMQRKVDGIIIYPSPELQALAKEINSYGIPVVQIMKSCEPFTNAVVINNFKAAFDATKHLINLGHKNIAMLNHNHETSEIQERFAGYCQAMNESFGTINHLTYNAKIDLNDSYEMTKAMLTKHPEIDAIFAASDMAALGTVKAALDCGEKIGKEFSVMGFDDLDIAAKQLIYPLSTVAQPKEEIGRLAGQMILDLLANKSGGKIILNAPLVIRNTTIKPL